MIVELSPKFYRACSQHAAIEWAGKQPTFVDRFYAYMMGNEL